MVEFLAFVLQSCLLCKFDQFYRNLHTFLWIKRWFKRFAPSDKFDIPRCSIVDSFQFLLKRALSILWLRSKQALACACGGCHRASRSDKTALTTPTALSIRDVANVPISY